MIEREFTVVLKLKVEIDGNPPHDDILVELLKERIYEWMPYCFVEDSIFGARFAIFNKASEIVSVTSDS